MKKTDTLRVLAVKHVSFDATLCVIPEFEKTLGMKVRVDYIHDEWEMYEKSKQLITAKSSAYDAFMVDSIWIYEYVARGMLECLETPIAEDLLSGYDFDDLIPEYVEGFCRVKDLFYALPLAGHTNFLAYRKDLLLKKRLKPPSTQSQLLEFVKAMASDEISGITLRGKAFELAYTYMLFLYPNCGKVLDENCRPCLDSEEAAATLDYLVKLWKYTPPGVFGFSFPDMAGAFVNGKAAVYHDASVGAILAHDCPLADRFGYSLTPAGRKVSTCVAGWSMGIPVASRHKREAFQYLQLMTSKKHEPDTLRAGRDPIRLSTLRDKDLRKKFPFLPAIEENLKHSSPWFRPCIPEFAGVLDILGRHLASVLRSECQPKAGLAKAQREIADVLARAGY